MKKAEKLTLLKELVIEKPCSENWGDMTGDEQVRMCSKCNLNVHMISAMNESEAAIVLKRRKTERTCVFFYRKQDGSIATDNCPKQLKKIRNRLSVAAAITFLVVAYAIAHSAMAAGATPLVGAAVDPAFGQANEVGMLAEYGYDTARDISRIITAISFIVVFLIPMSKQRKYTLRRVILELIALGCVPLFVHLAGNFAINNFGGLGGGGL